MKKIGWISVVALAAACAVGESGPELGHRQVTAGMAPRTARVRDAQAVAEDTVTVDAAEDGVFVFALDDIDEIEDARVRVHVVPGSAEAEHEAFYLDAAGDLQRVAACDDDRECAFGSFLVPEQGGELTLDVTEAVRVSAPQGELRIVLRSLASDPVAYASSAADGIVSPKLFVEPVIPRFVRSSRDTVAGQYTVVLEHGEDDVAELSEALTDEYGLSVLEHYDAALRGLSIEADEATAMRLAADLRVRFVEEVTTLEALASGTQSNAQWALDRIDERGAFSHDGSFTYHGSGEGVNLYVVDSGVDPTHPELVGRVTQVASFASGVHADDSGHGTAVATAAAGTTLGFAKHAQIRSVRIYGANTVSTATTLIQAINWVTANVQQPAVVNLSTAVLTGVNLGVDMALQASIDAGVTWVLAAGNSASDACTFSPARVYAAITVGSTDINNAVASSSNQGQCLDTFAPGVEINVGVPANVHPSRQAVYSGTSFAAPFVAGWVASLMEDYTMSPAQVRTALAVRRQTGVTGRWSTSPNALLWAPGTDAPPRMNPFHPYDTNNSGAVSPLDALLGINALNGATVNMAQPGPPYIDTTGNGTLSPLDILLVINYLNAG